MRVRAKRDLVLRSIRNLESLAQEARTDVQTQASFRVHYSMVGKYVDQFENHQEEVLKIMVDLEAQEEFANVDVLLTDEMEDLC